MNDDQFKDQWNDLLRGELLQTALLKAKLKQVAKKVPIQYISPAENVAMMGTIQIFQTGWQECLKFLEELGKSTPQGRQPPEDWGYLSQSTNIPQP